MDGLTTFEQCDRCKKQICILVDDFQKAMKDGDPVLCSDCYSEFLDEQTETIPKRQFEYKVVTALEAPFHDIGMDGWELVSVDCGFAYFKREKYEETE